MGVVGLEVVVGMVGLKVVVGMVGLEVGGIEVGEVVGLKVELDIFLMLVQCKYIYDIYTSLTSTYHNG